MGKTFYRNYPWANFTKHFLHNLWQNQFNTGVTETFALNNTKKFYNIGPWKCNQL